MNEIRVSSFLFYLIFSFARWQITSTEKLNARAKAVHSHHACLPKETSIMAKQKTLTIIVNAFFSVKYFLNSGEAVKDSSRFILCKYNYLMHQNFLVGKF